MPQETKYCHSSALATFPFQGSGVEVVDESGTLWTWGGSAYLKPVGSRKDPTTGLDVLDEGSRAVFVNSFGVSPTKFSMIGDSRTADLWSGGGKSSRNFFNWACAYYKQAPILVGNYGASGKRSDEYLTNGNFETALADGSGVLIFGYPAVNDIGTAFTGYTDAFGNVVTLANAASVIVGNLARYWRKAVDAGKKVVVLTEPGSTVQVASQVAVMHEINALIKKRPSMFRG